VTILVAEGASGGLKLLIERERPGSLEGGPDSLVDLPATFSFPSGHATVSFACATVLAFAIPRLAVPLYALAALIAFSRVYVGVHYPIDVIAGAALGVLIATALRMLAAARRRSTPPTQPG
jgi:undecaprenyl-diphosphatase